MASVFDARFALGSTHLIVGPSGSGKTYRTARILELKDLLIANGDRIKNIVFCYAAWQDIYTKLSQEKLVTKWVNKAPTNEEFKELVGPYRHDGGSLVVIDDFMGQISPDLVEIVCVTSRHFNASTFVLFQSLFPPHPLGRQISLNVKYIHIHKNPRENAQIASLARQISPGDWKWIVEAYHEITKQPHGCMLVDLTQETQEVLRFRSNIFPENFPMIAWMKKNRGI